MKVSLSGVSEYIKLSGAERSSLARRLPEIGVEVAGSETVEGETVLEVEATANRGDLLSVYGLAREIGAAVGRKPKSPVVRPYREPKMRGAVRIEKNSGCRRYLAARITGVRVGPSPEAAAKKLRLAGFAVINNLVDITNLILAEFGQPLHAFDADRLNGGIVVRRGRSGEKIAALDGKTYEVGAADIVIADLSRPVALAGVIGGTETAVTGSTRTVFLECAWFEPSNVRRTSRRLGVVTESSFRFERHVDPAGMERAFFQAIRLIEEWSGGKLAGIEMSGAAPKDPPPVLVSSGAIERVLGIRPPSAQITRNLALLGCRVSAAGKDRWKVQPPSYRPDLAIAEDVIEEVSRLYGIDQIPARRPVVRPARAHSENRQTLSQIRHAALAMGLSETVGMSFVSEELLKSVGVYPEEAVALENPLSLAASHLRPTLLPGILSAASLNLRRGSAESVRIFETGPVFLKKTETAPKSPDASPTEELRMAILLNGVADPVHFSRSPRQMDFFDLKGILENLMCRTGRVAGPVQWISAAIAGFDPAMSSAIRLGDLTIGCLGRIAASTAAKFDLPADVFVSEISLSRVLSLGIRSAAYQPLPRFPSIRRDLSLVINLSVKAADVRRVVDAAQIPNLLKVEIFDLYRGKGLPDGSYALGLTFTFQSPDRTLSDEEVNAARDSLIKLLGSELGAALRTG